jgi:hypothetical protein
MSARSRLSGVWSRVMSRKPRRSKRRESSADGRSRKRRPWGSRESVSGTVNLCLNYCSAIPLSPSIAVQVSFRCLPEAPAGRPPTAAVTAAPSAIPATAAACAAAAIISRLHADPGRHSETPPALLLSAFSLPLSLFQLVHNFKLPRGIVLVVDFRGRGRGRKKARFFISSYPLASRGQGVNPRPVPNGAKLSLSTLFVASFVVSFVESQPVRP